MVSVCKFVFVLGVALAWGGNVVPQACKNGEECALAGTKGLSMLQRKREVLKLMEPDDEEHEHSPQEAETEVEPVDDDKDVVLTKAANVVEAVTGGDAEAESVQETEKNGGKVDTNTALDVLNKAAEVMTVEEAELNDVVITADVIADLVGSQPEEAEASNDIEPSSDAEIALFEEVRRLNAEGKEAAIGAGTPWTDAHIKYCFASDLTAQIKALFMTSIGQYKSAVPCLTFTDVGNKGGAGSASLETSKACNSAPSIFVQSNPADTGCWSHLGMVNCPYNHNGNLMQT